MNKTQLELIHRLVNRYSIGSFQKGWTLTVSGDLIMLSLQKLNEGNQAHKLAESYPDIFEAVQKQWRLVNLKLLNESKARSLYTAKPTMRGLVVDPS